jgi:hypothetical protein
VSGHQLGEHSNGGGVGKLIGLDYCKLIEPPSPIVGKSTGVSLI